jgi:hypothetical protein
LDKCAFLLHNASKAMHGSCDRKKAHFLPLSILHEREEAMAKHKL